MMYGEDLDGCCQMFNSRLFGCIDEAFSRFEQGSVVDRKWQEILQLRLSVPVSAGFEEREKGYFFINV